MTRRDEYSEGWAEAEDQLSDELQMGLLRAKRHLFKNPLDGELRPDIGESVRVHRTSYTVETETEARRVSLTVYYTHDAAGDIETFGFRSFETDERLIRIERDVFVSYAHLDGPWFDKVWKLLETLKRPGDLRFWSDKQLRPGQKWLQEIRARLGDAAAAILMVSHPFLERPFVREEELPPLLDKAETTDAFKVSWIPVRDIEPIAQDAGLVDIWARISRYQALVNPKKPLDFSGKDKEPAKPGKIKKSRLKKLEKSLRVFMEDVFDAVRQT